MSKELIKLRFESFEAFLEECSERISEEGIFLATDTTRPVGSDVEFELGLDSDFPILRGSGEVVQVVEPGGAASAGVAVRYRDPEPSTVTVARRIAERQRARSGEIFDLGAFVIGDKQALDALIEPVLDEPVPIGTLDMPKLGDSPEPISAPTLDSTVEPTPTPTQAVDSLIVEGDESTSTGAFEPEQLSVTEPAAQPVPVHPWETEAEPEKKSGAALWLVLALVVAAAGAAYWQRDALLGLLSGEAGARPGAKASEPAESSVVEPAATEPTVAAVVEPEPAPEPSEPLGPIRRIEEIRWTSDEQGTLLELIGDGAIPAGGYSFERLVDPPRLLIKVQSVVAPLVRPNLAIGSSEIVGVRTGLHGTPPDTALHVVVDLADPTAEAGTPSVAGRRLQVRVASGAVSP